MFLSTNACQRTSRDFDGSHAKRTNYYARLVRAALVQKTIDISVVQTVYPKEEMTILHVVADTIGRFTTLQFAQGGGLIEEEWDVKILSVLFVVHTLLRLTLISLATTAQRYNFCQRRLTHHASRWEITIFITF